MLNRNKSDKYFSLLTDRECGECMVCCEHLSINAPNLSKPADVLCDNCIVDKGCQIYETRPNVCRTWHCLWRRIPELPLSLRPDKSGVIFSLVVNYESVYLFENTYIVCMALHNINDLKKPEIKTYIDRFIEEDALPVWLSYKGGMRLAHPEPALADAILHPRTTSHQGLIEDGREWKTQYEHLLGPIQKKHADFSCQFI